MVDSALEVPVAAADARATEPFVQLLGSPIVSVGEHNHALHGARSHLLLAYLAHGGQWVGRDRLASLFWPDHDNSAARRNLRYVLFNARALPFCGALQVDPHGARWAVATDLQQLRRAVTLQRWDDALDLCRGPLLDGLDATQGLRDWLEAERAAAAALWRDAVLGAAASGGARAVDAGRRLLAHDGFDEPVVLAVADALRRLDRGAEALQICRDYVERVRRVLGVEPSAQVQAVVEKLQPSRAPLAVRADLTQFFGRSAELREIDELIAEPDCRFLTLVGIGGSGKTRLARRFADRVDGQAIWVALESLDADQPLADALAQALDVPPFDAAHTPDSLVATLREGSRLLVLDNCEHVAGAVVALASHLLQHCPRLRVLATSRERLGIDGEWVLPVGGFACAKRDDEDAEAEQYFALCARRALPGFALGAANRPPVHALTRLVAGNPLALELAAAWVRALALPEIVAELRHDIGLLGAGTPGALERHASLLASFEHSWRLLSGRERDALARLAVFRGGFMRDAATQVAGVALPVLAALLDKSLLRYDGTSRYDRHPLIYQFTQRKLAADPVLMAQTRQRHARYFLRLLEQAISQPPSRLQRLQRLRAEWANILLATEWFAESADWPALERCASLIARDPSVFGNLDVGAAWGGRILSLLERADTAPPPALVAQIQADRLWLQIFLELPHRAGELAHAALEAARDSGNVRAEVHALRAIGHLARKGADNGEAMRRFESALQLARGEHMMHEEAMLLDAIAMVENRVGAYANAGAHARAALTINERIGSHEQRMYNYYNIGESLRLAGRSTDAKPWLERCVALARELDFEQFLTYALVACAQCHAAQGALDAALRCAEEAKSEALRLADLSAAGLARLLLARVHLELGDNAAGCRELRAAIADALQWADALVLVAAIPAVARLGLAQGRGHESARWLVWLAARPELSRDAAQEACELLAECAGADRTAHDDGGGELVALARDMDVMLADFDLSPVHRRDNQTAA